MKIIFELDDTCKICERGLKKFSKLSARNENAYAGRDLKTGKSVGKVELVPDQNASGIVTHWHIR